MRDPCQSAQEQGGRWSALNSLSGRIINYSNRFKVIEENEEFIIAC